jgi:hypothetical protein
MLLLDRQFGATAEPRPEANRPAAPAGRVQLRLRADGQLFELLPGKTTIGSSPRCNVRIAQPGVQPLHCVITDSPEGLRVRSWVANTALNGEPFEESALNVGDCLSLGRVELDIVDRPVGESQDVFVEAPTAKRSVADTVRAGRDQARTRSRQLLDTLRRERTNHEELCRQVVKLQESHLQAIAEQNEINVKLENCLAELAAARRQLNESEGVEAARRKLASQNEQLDREISELSAQINELTHARSETAKQRQDLADDLAAVGEQQRQLVDTNTWLKGELDQLSVEKAAADEQCRHLTEQNSQLQNEVARITHQKHEFEAEREGLRRQNEHLLGEARELARERGSLADERTSLCQARSGLRQQNETLQARIAELDEENSATSAGKLMLVEQCDTLSREVEQLQVRVVELNQENAALAAANTTLADEKARLVAEQKRLAELERERGEAVAGRESTSAELYRALLQLAELQERDSQNKAAVEVQQSLSKEHAQLHEEAKQLKEQINRLNEERVAAEAAWQALSAEAATLSESYDRMARENAALVARLDEAQQQLERTQQEQTTWTGAAELERERAAKLRAEEDVTSAIAEGERRLEEQERRFAAQAQEVAHQLRQLDERSRQHAEQSREYAETIHALEQQVAAANEARDSLARVREEAQFQLSEAEAHRNEQSLAKAAELAASESKTTWSNTIAEPGGSESAHAAREPYAPGETPAEFRWSSAPSEIAPETDWNSRGGDNTILGTGQSTAGETEWHQPLSEGASSGVPADADAFGEDDCASLARQPMEEAATGDSTSVWKQPAAQPGPLFEEPLFDKSEALIQPETKLENSPTAKHQPPSFIDRYSHLFTDDDAASDDKPSRVNEAAQPTPPATSALRSEGEGLSASNSDDEDSIEQSMANLLQRVRGESALRAAAAEQTAPANVPAEQPIGRPIEHCAPVAVESTATPGEADAHAADAQPVERSEPVKRRVATPMPATDLGALRALANETARKAISRHELGTLRRNAVTKVIVATLAGVTSLWLMLQSPDWRNVHFITACGLLLVAAYWAGETYRTLLNLTRIRAYEGPEDTADDEASPLPIDVEARE